MGHQDHPTTQPEQVQTDEFAVFSDNAMSDDLVLIDRVTVPRYSVPNSDGVELNFDKRISLAVAFAVEAEHTSPPAELVLGDEYMVMHDVSEAMSFVTYVDNPSFGAVWNPNEQSVEEFVNDE